MIFPDFECEPIVQIDDRTRLSAAKSYASKGVTITKVEIQPDAGGDWILVSGTKIKPADWYTDWQYDSDGTKTPSVRVNEGTPEETIKTFEIEVVTEAEDALFSSDADLVEEEPNILGWMKPGRNSFKNVHREVQRQILDLLNRKGYRTTSGAALTKTNVVDHSQVREMAKYLALHLIFSGISNQVGDVFSQKAGEYRSKFNTVSGRQIIGLDLNGDSVVDSGEGVNLSSARLIRR